MAGGPKFALRADRQRAGGPRGHGRTGGGRRLGLAARARCPRDPIGRLARWRVVMQDRAIAPALPEDVARDAVAQLAGVTAPAG